MEGGRGALESPIGFLDDCLSRGSDAAWIRQSELVVGDPDDARAVLANRTGAYREHSDFFFVRGGPLAPRSAQQAIARAAHGLLGDYIAHRAAPVADAVAGLPATTTWPDAGNRLLYRHLRDALICPSRSSRTIRVVDDIVERSVLAGAHRVGGRLGRFLYRYRTIRALSQDIERSRASASREPRDLLDVVAFNADADSRPDQLAEVFLSFVFACAGSLGFALAWAVYLVGTNDRREMRPAAVVREALRLWPVAWMLAREPAQAHRLADMDVGPGTKVVVCPYMVHRHPDYWAEPGRFLPERWDDIGGVSGRAFLPFGYGPHRCVAASLSLRLLTDFVDEILRRYEIAVRVEGEAPGLGVALSPPRFELDLRPGRHLGADAPTDQDSAAGARCGRLEERYG